MKETFKKAEKVSRECEEEFTTNPFEMSPSSKVKWFSLSGSKELKHCASECHKGRQVFKIEKRETEKF